MTNKTTVLKHLDQYRSKELTMGCEVQPYGLNCLQNRFTVVREGRNEEYQCVSLNEEKPEYKWIDRDMMKFVFGHPATLNTLLMALNYKFKCEINIVAGRLIIGTPRGEVTIPLTPTNLADIPESDDMWKSLVDVFNL